MSRHFQGCFAVYDRARIHLILCNDPAEEQFKFKNIADESLRGNKYSGLAMCLWPDHYIFLDEKDINKRTIAHEIFHVTLEVMRGVGVKCHQSNDEAMAFINDWLTGWVYTKLGSRKIPTNKRLKKL